MKKKYNALDWFDNELSKMMSFEDVKAANLYIDLLNKAKMISREDLINYHKFLIYKFVHLKYTFNTDCEIIINDYYSNNFK